LQAIYDSLKEISKTDQVTDQVKKILTIIGDGEFTAKELMDKIGLKDRPTFRNNYLVPAMKLGLIEMTITGKSNSNKQRYRRAK
jgi:hypothetical protein